MIIKMFDYWAFHDDGRIQFFQITEGEITDYRVYACLADAPIVLIKRYRTTLPELRYHGRSYVRRLVKTPVDKPN